MSKDKKIIEENIKVKDSENKLKESKDISIKENKNSEKEEIKARENKPVEKNQTENSQGLIKKSEDKKEKDEESKVKETKTEQKNSNELKSKSSKKTLTSPVSKDNQKKITGGENKTNDTKSNQHDNSGKNFDQNEFIEKLVSINRVAKVVKGGRRFSFAALVVVGDGNGMVGHGKGKAKEVPEAIKKATEEAKNNLIRVPLRQGRTLHHDIRGRFDSGIVYLRSAPSGTGVIAGGPMRAVFEALGIQDIVAKSVGTSNPHNMVRATFEALKTASSPKIIAMRRNLKINDITKRRKNSTQVGEIVKN